MFLKEESDAILSIPISYRLPEDELFWPLNEKGKYSVKSGYFLAEKLRLCTKDSPTSSSKNEDFWKSIWRLKLPLKVIHFIWRLCKQILPSFKALNSRGVNVDPICPRCAGIEESLMHIFQFCPFSKQIWKKCEFRVRVDKVVTGEPYEWILVVKRKLSPDDFELFVVLLWWIWGERNNIVHGKNLSSANLILAQSKQWLDNWRSIQRTGDNNSQPIIREIESAVKRWTPPQGTSYKVNVDATWKAAGAKGGAGVAVRDAGGEVLLAAGIPIEPSTSAFLAELRGLVGAMDIVADAGFTDVIFELDCLQLVHSLQARVCVVGADSLFFEDVLLKIQRFHSIAFSYVSRDCNMLAHALAQWANTLESSVIMIEKFPSVVTSIVQNELSFS